MRDVTTVDSAEQPQEIVGLHVYEAAEMKWIEFNERTMISKTTTDIIDQLLVVKNWL
jgi:hypothetical protein